MVYITADHSLTRNLTRLSSSHWTNPVWICLDMWTETSVRLRCVHETTSIFSASHSCLSRGFPDLFDDFNAIFPAMQHCQTILLRGFPAPPCSAPGRRSAHHPCSAIFLRQLRRELGPTGLSSDAAEDLTHNYLGDFFGAGVIGILIEIYPLVMTSIAMERSTILKNGVKFYKWAISHGYVKLPDGILGYIYIYIGIVFLRKLAAWSNFWEIAVLLPKWSQGCPGIISNGHDQLLDHRMFV